VRSVPRRRPHESQAVRALGRESAAEQGSHEDVVIVTPRRARALLEHALDEAGWPYVRWLSLALDLLVLREEQQLGDDA
jgi:hypothetical protein